MSPRPPKATDVRLLEQSRRLIGRSLAAVEASLAEADRRKSALAKTAAALRRARAQLSQHEEPPTP